MRAWVFLTVVSICSTSASPPLAQKFADPLKDRDGKGGGLAGTGLSLSDTITPSNDGHDRTLLYSRRPLETICVNAAEKVGFQLHVVETEEASTNQPLIKHL